MRSLFLKIDTALSNFQKGVRIMEHKEMYSEPIVIKHESLQELTGGGMKYQEKGYEHDSDY
jgi:hypothetical protein